MVCDHVLKVRSTKDEIYTPDSFFIAHFHSLAETRGFMCCLATGCNSVQFTLRQMLLRQAVEEKEREKHGRLNITRRDGKDGRV